MTEPKRRQKEAKKIIKALLGIFCISLLGIPVLASDAGPNPWPDNSGNAHTTTNLWNGELTSKCKINGNYYVNLYNSDDGITYSGLYVSKHKYSSAVIGKNYEWKRINYPGGMEVISFHMI